jgi:KUP system potassium uptake protein
MSAAASEQRTSVKLKLAMGAVGVVYGDIGTSPLYAMKETFVGHHPLAVDLVHVFGVVSVMFWSLVILVTGKYVFLTLRADNKGEGGSLALLALIQRKSGGGRWSRGLVLLGIFATALFLGDCMITPAISVLSAVEGLTVVQGSFTPFVLPIASGILLALFMIQKRGTERVGTVFGPLMLVYFLTIAVLGIISIAQLPSVLQALNPLWIVRFFAVDPYLAFLALGSSVLALTGAEALYADMGHFGRKPIQLAWLYLVFPALLLNYLGQASLLTRVPSAVENPFFLLAPDALRLPLVLLATAATVIASQAVISGAFSVVQQAVQLGVMPRIRISHTSARALGQIYIPAVNWGLMVLVIFLIVSFRESSNLAAAYGIAVTGTMICTTIMLTVLVHRVWNWPLPLVVGVIAVFLLLDSAYFAANLTKIPDGGWFPLLVGAIAFTLLTTWAKGRRLMRERMAEVVLPLDIFAKSARNSTVRVPGTAIFMNSGLSGTPSALLHNIKHNKVLHERVVVVTIAIADVPHVNIEERYEITNLGDGFYRVVLHYGFMEETDVPAAIKQIGICGGPFEMMSTSFFLSRQTLLSSKRPGMAIWREKLFAWMMRNAATPMQFFNLPTNRVVELGSQVEI